MRDGGLVIAWRRSGFGVRDSLFLSSELARRALQPALVAGALASMSIITPAVAQVPGPDPRQMSGIPLSVSELSDGVVSVRLVRGQLSNNVPSHPVELHADGRVFSARTDDTGRAQFTDVPVGAKVHAVATVDGERLESQPFEVPARGGMRVILVAAQPAAQSAAATAPAAPQPGTVSLGGESRVVVEMDDEAVRVFYLLEIVNTQRAPVTPTAPLVFEMPPGAQGVAVLEGSTSQATAGGSRVTVTGPFASGRTAVQIGYVLPYAGGRLEVSQRWPVALETVAVVVEKAGDMRLASPQVDRRQDMQASGRTFIVGGGPGVPANGVVTLELSGLPHHSAWPRNVALALAAAIILWGVWAGAAGAPATGGQRHRELDARREKLFGELVRVEQQHQTGQLDGPRDGARREELIAQLEQIYARLDEESGPVALAAPTRGGRGSALARRSGPAA